mmetsp:Transcript_65428/g.75235  ORF Transcript_65428/g.75235 Transcript_65428/m.75235 type:complete len:102 (-) Transcript_65428:1147-1452(-)
MTMNMALDANLGKGIIISDHRIKKNRGHQRLGVRPMMMNSNTKTRGEKGNECTGKLTLVSGMIIIIRIKKTLRGTTRREHTIRGVSMNQKVRRKRRLELGF